MQPILEDSKGKTLTAKNYKNDKTQNEQNHKLIYRFGLQSRFSGNITAVLHRKLQLKRR
jgi:hypothetical protein